MPLIDFRIAPDFGLGARPGTGPDPAAAAQLQVMPTVALLPPIHGGDAPIAFGLVGRF